MVNLSDQADLRYGKDCKVGAMPQRGSLFVEVNILS